MMQHSLVLWFVVVALTLVLGRLIPFVAIPVAPGLREMLLLVIVWVSVPVGAILDDGI